MATNQGSDTFELTSSLLKGAENKEKQARINDTKLYKGKTIKYSISPLYQRYLGRTVTIAFNGNFRKLPVDGTEFEISEGHYNALKKYLNYVDRQIKISQQNANFMGEPVNGDFKKI